jgi:hypothetical protein
LGLTTVTKFVTFFTSKSVGKRGGLGHPEKGEKDERKSRWIPEHFYRCTEQEMHQQLRLLCV